MLRAQVNTNRFTHSRWTRVLARPAACILALVFVIAAFGKALSPRDATLALAWAGLPPEIALRALIGWEIVLGVWFASGLAPRTSAILTITTLLVFLSWIGWLIAANAPVPCGCGSPIRIAESPNTDRWSGIVRNAVLAVTALPVLVFSPSHHERSLPRRGAGADALA